MHTAGVDGTVQGPDTRVVTFVVYPVNGAIVIPLPNGPMVEKDNNYLKQLTHNGTQAAPYPLQSFYSACFAGRGAGAVQPAGAPEHGGPPHRRVRDQRVHVVEHA